MLNLPHQNRNFSTLLQNINRDHVNNDDLVINTRIFKGFDNRYILKEIASLMKIINKVVTYRVNGELSDLQRQTMELAQTLGIDLETITINTWDEN